MESFSKRITVAFGVLRKGAGSLIDDAKGAWVSLLGDYSRVNKDNLMDQFRNWVFVAVNKIAGSASEARLRMFKYDKDGHSDEVVDHDAIKILYRPNQWQSFREFFYSTVVHLELIGNAFWLKQRAGASNKGKLTGLIPLNPKYVTLHIGDDGVPDKFLYRLGTRVIEYNIDQIFHLKYPNPQNIFYGQSVLLGVADWVDVDNYMTEFNRKFFINGATFGGMIKTKATTQSAIELIRLGLNSQHQGVVNAHKIGILPDGAEFQETKQSFRDMEFNAGDQLFRDKVLSGFGVPKSVVGITESGSSKADAEAKNYVFQKFTVKPKLDIIADFLSEVFLEEWGASGNFYFDFVNPVADDEELAISIAQAGLSNMPFMTINEVRVKQGLPPINNGDVVMGNGLWVPVGDVADLAKEPKSSPVPRMKSIPKQIKNADSEKVADKLTAAALKLLRENDPIEKNHKAFIARVGDYEKQVAMAVVKHDAQQKELVLHNLKLVVRGGIDPKKLLNFDEAVKALSSVIRPIAEKLYVDQGKRAYQDVVAEAGQKGIKNALKKKAFDTDTTGGRIAAYLDASMKKMAKKYTRTTVDTLVQSLSDGIAKGEDLNMLAARVSNVYDFTEGYRAMRLARTETFSIANDASRAAYIQSEVVQTVKWHTAEDELKCQYCAPLDGKTVDVDEGFFSKGDEAEGDDGGSLALDYESVENPPLHANCRCFILADKIEVKSAVEPDELTVTLKNILKDDE